MRNTKSQFHIPLGYTGPLPKPPEPPEPKRKFKRTIPPVTARALIHGCISAPEWSMKMFRDLGGAKAATTIEFGAIVDFDDENKGVNRDDALAYLGLTIDEATDKWLAQYAHKVAWEKREAGIRSDARETGYLNYPRQQWISYVVDRLENRGLEFEAPGDRSDYDIFADCPFCKGKRTLSVKVITTEKEVQTSPKRKEYRESTGALFRCSSCIDLAKDEAQAQADQYGLPVVQVSDGYRNAVTFELGLITGASLYGRVSPHGDNRKPLPYGDKVELRRARQNIIRYMMGSLAPPPIPEIIPTLGPAARKRAFDACQRFINRKEKDGKQWRLAAKLYREILKLGGRTDSLVATDVNYRELMLSAGLHDKGGSMSATAAKQLLIDRGLVQFYPEDRRGSYVTVAVCNPRTRMPYAFDLPTRKSPTKNRRPNDSPKLSSWDYSG